MLIRPSYCCDKKCEKYLTAKKLVTESSSISKAQAFLDDNFKNNSDCKKCKETFYSKYKTL